MSHSNVDLSLKIMSDAVTYSKYARYIPEKRRRESWPEIADRYVGMMRRRFPFLEDELNEIHQAILNYEVVPSMRGIQFAGEAIERKNARLFNCSMRPITHRKVFSELVYLLLCGSGTGYSVQHCHINQMKRYVHPTRKLDRTYVIEDSIEGWADALDRILKSYLEPGENLPKLDYSLIRPKGSLISSTGSSAPGPEPLRNALDAIIDLLDSRVGTELTSLDLHDIMCHASNAVVAGGVRRSAMICFFDNDDELMLWCKHPDKLADNPQRYRSNNSAVMVRGEHDREDLLKVFEVTQACRTGEPAVYWTNDRDMLSNPCVEASLNEGSFCNLSSISAKGINSQAEFDRRARIASLIGTMQATFTDFSYLSKKWKETTDEDALLGVSITGIGLGTLKNLNLSRAAGVVKDVNELYAKKLGINTAARTTLVKPEGTSSCVLMTPSGIHPFEASHYIRRMTLYKDEPLYDYLASRLPGLVEDSVYEAGQAYFTFPIKAPENAVTSCESLETFLNRVKRYNEEWIAPGHRRGANKHNVSCTAKIGEGEWELLVNWMWENRNSYNGISAFPKFDNYFSQPIFEEIDDERWRAMMDQIDRGIDLTEIEEVRDNTKLSETVACSGGQCEVTFL